MHFHENKYSKNVILETLSTSGHSHIHSCRCISLQVCSLQRKYSHLAAAVATFILQKFVLYFVRWWRYLWKAVAPRNSFLMMLCYFEKNSQSFICHTFAIMWNFQGRRRLRRRRRRSSSSQQASHNCWSIHLQHFSSEKIFQIAPLMSSSSSSSFFRVSDCVF